MYNSSLPDPARQKNLAGMQHRTMNWEQWRVAWEYLILLWWKFADLERTHRHGGHRAHATHACYGHRADTSLPPRTEAIAGMSGMRPMTAMPMSSFEVSELATKGVWELLPCHAPLLPVHGAVLHTGRVLLFAGSGNDELYTTGLRSAVWDYNNGEWTAPFTPVDFFCAGQSFLPDGRLLVAGGTKEYDINGHGFIGLSAHML